KARSLFRNAAGLGHGPAHHRLGAIFQTGTGVDADATEAARWFRKAAELGVAASQIAMGDLLQSGLAGEGTPEDARAWFEMAARRDHPEAGARLAALDAAFREGVQPKV
ncbi:MAG: sel1 repeat family protein, partial [Methanobacterium sp.]|nr:sel1 repeat family protein [Methanobacterium sp.]